MYVSLVSYVYAVRMTYKEQEGEKRNEVIETVTRVLRSYVVKDGLEIQKRGKSNRIEGQCASCIGEKCNDVSMRDD
jgi:predicted nucleic acid binding AN1-type Zn finger protein